MQKCAGSLWLMLAVALLLLAPAVPARAVRITFLPPPTAESYFRSQATALQPALQDEFILSTLPVSTTTEASKDGDTATANWSMSHDRLDAAFLHVVSGLNNSAAIARALLFFRVDQDVTYSFSGNYDMTGAARQTTLRVDLTDMGSNTPVYSEFHYSTSTNGKSFELGTPGGDVLAALTGSRQGPRVAARRYRLLLSASLSGESTGQAFATGVMHMVLPEPGTGLLVMAGLLVLASRRSW